MTAPFSLSNTQARQLFMERQGLSAPPRTKLTTAGLLDIIHDLGFVQVDSINTVARAHHMILFARNQTYQPKHLTHLLEKDRTLFEHWTHDAAVIPTAFYPYWQHRFLRDETRLLKQWRIWRREGFEHALASILDKVSRDGPLMTRDISTKRAKGSAGWWDWQPEKTALEFHWRTGKLAIAGRDGFQKIYDLAENVIPAPHCNDRVHEPDFIDWACRSALTRLGVATSGEIAAFWALITPKEAAAWVQTNRSVGALMDVVVENHGDRKPTKAVAFSDMPDTLETVATPPDRVRILSPFDPLIRDRKRCERLFGFDYRIEVFVPKEKRQYGYYVFPLLEGSRFIGRIDVQRQGDALVVENLWLELGIKMGKDRKKALDAELERYRRFTGTHAVTFARSGLPMGRKSPS